MPGIDGAHARPRWPAGGLGWGSTESTKDPYWRLDTPMGSLPLRPTNFHTVCQIRPYRSGPKGQKKRVKTAKKLISETKGKTSKTEEHVAKQEKIGTAGPHGLL